MKIDLFSTLRGKLCYLACPYSDPDPAVRESRYLHAMRAQAALVRNKVMVYSPIVAGHPLAVMYSLPTDYKYWKAYDERMLKGCDLLLILCDTGWAGSKGIQSEMKAASKLGIKAMFVRLIPGKSWKDDQICAPGAALSED